MNNAEFIKYRDSALSNNFYFITYINYVTYSHLTLSSFNNTFIVIHKENKINVKVKIGNRIRFLRLQRKLSQEELALTIEMDRTYLNSVENGRRNISIVNLEKIWRGLQITPYEFFKDF